MAVYIANNVVDNETYISTAEQTETILGLLAPLIKDQEDGPTPDKWDDQDEFVEEQALMGKVVHMLKAFVEAVVVVNVELRRPDWA